jgi:VanZ family protein
MSLFIALFLFAGVTELLQLTIIGRSATFRDWLIDITGILLGITIVIIFQGKKPGYVRARKK